MRKQQTILKEGTFYKITGLLKSAKVLKVKQRLKDCSILKANEKMLTSKCKVESELHRFAIKDIIGTTCEN